MTKLPPFNSYWVVPDQFMAGEYPGNDYDQGQSERRLDALIEAGITTFIDLTEEDERFPYAPLLQERAGYYQVKINYQRFSIGDFGIPTEEKMRTILDAIQQAINIGEKPYVHCWAGMGRTGTVVGCYLAENGLNGPEALLKVDELCYYAPSPQTGEQKRFVRNWR
jgi:hypothetical protein